MHGGVKVYRGAAAAARNYLEADRSRADDYYLAEGTGIGRRFTAGPDAPVVEFAPLTGDGYEAWVAGLDPDTGEPRGRVRADGHAVRFVEVTVNGPKSWSLAAELHPDIAVAYELAQDRAAAQVIAWLGQNATTRVGPRGAQIALPVQRLEAVTVRHYTSRAGDPHRHLHLQINARVFAAGKWRGLDTVAVRDSIAAINGIGHAAVACDPGFRAALAAHGYTLNESGEIEQLAQFVGPFSRRTAQVTANIDRYETEWRAAHPGEEPGPAQWRAWDARAWAEQRPDKVTPEPGMDVHGRWLEELTALGYRDRDRHVQLTLELPGALDRAAAVAEVVARLGAARSAWNVADVRGEVEHLLARTGVVSDAAVHVELAEDLTARALHRCVPLHELATPEHVRALTSQHVLDVEAGLAGRLAARGTEPVEPATPAATLTSNGELLDTRQADAVAALTSAAALVVIEGAAGVGKTTLLAAARRVLERDGRRLVVVTPTLKAAKAATQEIGARAGSAAWLVHQHGWRWDEAGRWTRLALGELDPATGGVYRGPNGEAELRASDVLLVDEAGMLDQDTARALLTVADECATQVAFVGDRHQLPAVGRGGVLDLAHRWADPSACLTLDEVHRFDRETITAAGQRERVADHLYAVLTLQMRLGENPADVFDSLLRRGQVVVHGSEQELREAIAEHAAADRVAGRGVAVVVDTREQAATLNAAIRDRLIDVGVVDDRHATSTGAGQHVGVGDVIATRRNDHQLDVANRDTWTVTHVHRDGALTVTGAAAGQRQLPAEYVRKHVELGYATTAHGAQGGSATTAHLVLGEHTTAASAYVGMTRGRQHNTAHLVADNLDQAREQWTTAFDRNRADLGPAHAAEQAVRETAGYAPARPMERLLAELRETWSRQAEQQRQLDRAVKLRDRLDQIAALRTQRDQALAPLETRYEQFRHDAEQARVRAEQSAAAITEHAEAIRDRLLREWDAQREQARQAAHIVQNGSGRLGLRLAVVNRATETLARWSTSWQPYLPDMPTSTARVARFADWSDNRARLFQAFDQHARRHAEHAHPEHPALRQAAETTQQRRTQAWAEAADTREHYRARLDRYGALANIDNPDQRLDDIRREIASTQGGLAVTGQRLDRLSREPAVQSQPAGWLDREHQRWQADDAAESATARQLAQRQLAPLHAAEALGIGHHHDYPAFGHDTGREGPSFGR